MPEIDRERLFAAARDALLDEFPYAWATYVYGSFVDGAESSRSDLDLAVLLPPGREIVDPLERTARLAARTGRDIDLVDLRKAGDVLRHEVLRSGRVLSVRAPDDVLAWEASSMSRYTRHREEIREILEGFARTGIGYAP